MNTLSYQTPQPVHRGALIIFWLAIATSVMFFLVIPSIVVLIAAIIIGRNVEKHPDRPGIGYAVWAARISFISCIVGLLTLILMPSLGSTRRSPNVCASNLRGLTQSMNVYAADNNDNYPSVAFAPYSAGLNDARATTGSTDPSALLAAYYHPPFRQAGSPQAILWQLVLRGDVSAKSFICKSDPFATAPAQSTTPAGNNFDNFQAGRQLSYSLAYPWKSDGTLGNWWKATIDASLPIASDMAPENGTGTPARNLTALTKISNSLNHQSDGQNVAFADSHVEFARLPNIGQSNDNIFTSSAIPSRGPSPTGLPATKTSPTLTAETPPYDIIMYPIRNETTGGF